MPPKRAAAPTAAVRMGAACVLLEVVRTPPPAPASVSVAMGAVDVGPSMPLVKGLLPSVAVAALVNAAGRLVAVVSGSAAVLLGFRTLGKTC